MDEPLRPEDYAADGSGNERGDPRDSMFLQAVLTRANGGDPVTLRVRNISAHGLMAECTGAFVEGEVVQVEVRGLGQVPGRIAWTRPPQMGVTFDVEVDPKLARKPVGPQKGRDPIVHRPL